MSDRTFDFLCWAGACVIGIPLAIGMIYFVGAFMDSFVP